MLKLACRYRTNIKLSQSARLLQKPNKYSTLNINPKLMQQKYLENLALYGYRYFSNIAPTNSVIADLFQQRQQFELYYLYHDSSHRRYHIRTFHLDHTKYETNSSKVDETVKTLKNKQKEKVDEIMKEVSNNAAATDTLDSVGKAVKNNSEVSKTVAPKKPLGTRIWEEVVHYYHGFRLLFIDVGVCCRLIWRVLNGKTLSRRENKLLQRTAADIFRLIPFSVFIIVPFLELTLPLFIKFFPNMLPSTFTTAKEHDEKLQKALQMRLEMARFLQKTLDEMPAQHKDHKSEEAKNFELFFEKIKDPNSYVPNEEIIKFAKRFNDEITLSSMSREQLAALCRMLELNTIGTSALLRFQLNLKLRSLAADDRVIAREGIESLDLFELQQACKSRGMRAYGLTEERLRAQLTEWIDLSLNEKVPPTLLLLSRTMHSYDESITTDKFKQILRELPESAVQQTKAAIGECEGKIDNKTKIQIIKEEEKRIQEEREEEREQGREIKEKPEPIVATSSFESSKPKDSDAPCAEISRTDVQLLSDALKSLSDKTMCVEKETIKEIKEELQEYKEDVEELCEVGKVVKEPIKERRGAKLLYNKVNSMIDQLDIVLKDLEKKKEQEIIKSEKLEPMPEKDKVQIEQLVETVRKIRENTEESEFKQLETLLSKLDADKDGFITSAEVNKFVENLPKNCPQIDEKHYAELSALIKKQSAQKRTEELVRIDELMQNIKKIKETSTESRVKHIEKVLEKLDDDKDGVITVNEVLKVVESLGRENIKLSDKQIDELVTLIEKEEIIEAEERIEKALAKIEREKAKKSGQNDTTTASAMPFGAPDLKVQQPSPPKNPESLLFVQDPIKPPIKGSIKTDDILKDSAPILKDSAIDLNKLEEEREKAKKTIRTGENFISQEALEKQKEKILPKSVDVDITKSSVPPQQPPTSSASSTTSPKASLSPSSPNAAASKQISTPPPSKTTVPTDNKRL